MRLRLWSMSLVAGLIAVGACATGDAEFGEDEDDSGTQTATTTGGLVGSGGSGPAATGPGPGSGGSMGDGPAGVGGNEGPAPSSSGQGGSGGAPSQWSCDVTYYGDAICDCGCGVIDIDCADATVGSCDYCDDSGSCATETCPANIDPNNNAVCVAVVCGNSVVEPGEQCDDGNTTSGDGCDALCQAEVPTGWTCSASYYGGMDGCDCGCGVVDPDCSNSTNAVCDYCNNVGGCQTVFVSCPGLIDPNNNAVCIATVCGNSTVEPGEDCDDGNTTSGDGCDATCQFEVPMAWTCNTSYYGTNDGCDCGCGVVDPDCASSNVGDCEYCDDTGSCGTGACPANINPTNNAVCI